MSAHLESDALRALQIDHGFGLRDAVEPPGVRRPVQVHGAQVARLEAAGAELPEADAISSALPGVPVGVVTADCVPVLFATRDGRLVAAAHAGWKGLAQGVLEACVRALEWQGTRAARLVAAIGPHIGPCCYEVDSPVLEPLSRRYPRALARAARETRAGHALLDLGRLAAADLHAAGIPPDAVARVTPACTRCDDRFHSHRRDGAAAGRMLHWIAARPLRS